MTVRIAFAILAAFPEVSLLSAGAGAIGIAESDGAIMLDNAKTAGNATIFEGTTLQTLNATSQVEMKNGARVRFDADSRGKLFYDHVDLEKGSALIQGFAAKANGLTVRGEGMAMLSLQGEAIEVTAVEGNVRVFSANGVSVANLFQGGILNLRIQDARAGSPSVMVGCVAKSDGIFRLRDDVTNVTVPLRGGSIRAGGRFRITGTVVQEAGGTALALRVTGAEELPGTCASGAVPAAVGAVAGISTTFVVAGAASAGATGAAVAVTATRFSLSATKSSTQGELDCMMRRGRPCRSPSPTGSSGQSGQLSGGK